MENNQPNGARLCIFCGSGRQSGEHIYSQWLHPQLERFTPPYRSAVRSRLVRTKSGEIDFVLQAKPRKNEKTISTKIPGPCRSCNSGWMNNSVEKPVRDILPPLIEAKRTTLEIAQVRKLVEWLVLKFMCVDYESGAPVMTAEDRKAFCERRTIPPSLMGIWAAPLSVGASWSARWERCGGIDAATFTFGMGHVLFHMWCHPDQTVRFDGHGAFEGRMQEIWPLRSLNAWPPFASYLLDEHANELAQSYDTIRRQRGIKIVTPKPIKKLKIIKNPHPASLRWVLDKETKLIGQDYEDQVCGGCSAVLLTDLSIDSMQASFGETPVPNLIVCPHCAALNVLPLKRRKARA